MEEKKINSRIGTVDRFTSTSGAGAAEAAEKRKESDRLSEFFTDTKRFGARIAQTVLPEGSTAQKVLFAIPGLGDLIKKAYYFFYQGLNKVTEEGLKRVEEQRQKRRQEEETKAMQIRQSEKAVEAKIEKRDEEHARVEKVVVEQQKLRVQDAPAT